MPRSENYHQRIPREFGGDYLWRGFHLPPSFRRTTISALSRESCVLPRKSYGKLLTISKCLSSTTVVRTTRDRCWIDLQKSCPSCASSIMSAIWDTARH